MDIQTSVISLSPVIPEPEPSINPRGVLSIVPAWACPRLSEGFGGFDDLRYLEVPPGTPREEQFLRSTGDVILGVPVKEFPFGEHPLEGYGDGLCWPCNVRISWEGYPAPVDWPAWKLFPLFFLNLLRIKATVTPTGEIVPSPEGVAAPTYQHHVYYPSIVRRRAEDEVISGIEQRVIERNMRDEEEIKKTKDTFPKVMGEMLARPRR
jgi:hypothetical protein